MPAGNEVVLVNSTGTELTAATGLMVRGAAADGAAKAGNPVLVAGQDGTNAQSILTDTTGAQVAVGAAASGAAKVGAPVLCGGQDGTNAVTNLVDSSGRQVVVGGAADGAAVAGNPVLVGGTDGTNAQSFAATTGGQQVVTIPGTWAVTHSPAVNTQATISQAAGGGTVKNVCTSIICSLCSDGAPTPELIKFHLRDGATGAGTILQTIVLSLVATSGDSATFAATGLNLVGTANTAMTLESDSAPGANVYAAVAMSGYTLPS